MVEGRGFLRQQAGVILLFVALAFIYRLFDAWPQVKTSILVATATLVAVGGICAFSSGNPARRQIPAGNRLLDYLAIALAVLGGNAAYRVFDSFPDSKVLTEVIAGVALISAFIIARYNVKRVSAMASKGG